MRRRPCRSVCAVAVLALVAALPAGCSSRDKVAAADSTAAKPNGAPIKLMAIYEGTGPSSSPEVPEGAIAAAKAINAKGGINGRPVEIVTCDTHNDPNTATGCGRRAVADGIVALVGNQTIYGNQFLPLMARNKIASIGLEPTTAADFTSPSAFPIAGGAPVNLAGLAAALARSGAHKIVLARVDIAESAPLPQFVNSGLKSFNLTLARDVPVPVGAPDMSPYAAAALKGGTDGIVIASSDQDAVNFVLAAREANPTVKIALIATSLGDVIKALQASAEGVIETSSVTVALKDPAEKQYEKDMKAAGYQNITGYRLASYASVLLFEKVAEQLPVIAGAAVFDAFNQQQHLDVGLTPPLQFTHGGIGGLPRIFNPCQVPTQIKDGQSVPLTSKFQNVFTGRDCQTPA